MAYDSFEDPELRYRQRYVDLIVNEGVKETFVKRATVIKTMRTALDERHWIHGSGNSYPAIHPRRSKRASVHHSSQLAGYGSVPAYRYGAVSETI